MDAAAGDDQRPLGVAQCLDDGGQLALVGAGPAQPMQAGREELPRVVEGHGLHVLGECQCHRPAGGRIGQDLDRRRQAGQDLFGPGDAVPVARHRLEAIVGRHRGVGEAFHLLQHGVGAPRRENVARQEKHRQPVDVGDGGGGHHVGGARPDRGGAGHQPPAVHRLGIGDGDQGHGLLVVGAIGGKMVAGGIERFAQAGHVAVPEDGEDAGEHRNLVALDLDPLGGQIAHQGLGHGQSLGGHLEGLLGVVAARPRFPSADA